jgi:hypothetical protein
MLFLAAYPEQEDLKDGMMQRIFSVDRYFRDQPRVYLAFSTIRSFKRIHRKEGDLVDIYRCHVILDFFFIIRLLSKSSKIYIHSLYNVIYALFYLMFFKKEYVFDAHGVVPEEIRMEGKNFRAHIYDRCEAFIFSRKKMTVICVTDAMIKHFKAKYKHSNVRFVRYCIFPQHLYEDQDIERLDSSFLRGSDDIVNIVYSGNTQQWQNIELMLKTIAENIGSKNYNFIILTGELAKMQTLVKEFISNNDRIIVKSVEPEELFQIYNACHYGFVLRDDILVNNVSCPTKLIEYLFYGIIPIVLSDEIGDFKQYGYQRIHYNNLNGLVPKKSSINKDVIHRMMLENSKIDLAQL